MKKNVFSELEVAMITEDLNIRRYLKSNVVDVFKENQVATLNYPNGYGHGSRVHSDCVALTTGQTPIVKVRKENMLRIRKLTPCECIKLMGFTPEDFQALKDIGLSDSAIYHCAGDSIITTCLVGLLNPFVNEEHEHIRIVEDYVKNKIILGN